MPPITVIRVIKEKKLKAKSREAKLSKRKEKEKRILYSKRTI